MLITVAICTLDRAESLRRTLDWLAAMVAAEPPRAEDHVQPGGNPGSVG